MKYKRCCGSSTRAGEDAARRIIAAAEGLPAPRGREPIGILHRGKRVQAVGDRVYWVDARKTFHDFLIHHLKDTIGRDWGLSEMSKPFDDRHVIVQWLRAMANLQDRNTTPENEDPGGGVWSATATGEVQALISLAYDLYLIRHAMNLHQPTINRLRSKQSFQGARYEIAVASIFSRAGFTLEYLEPDSSKGKSVEFLARADSGETIAVEAKSRHRDGVLGFPGALDLQRASRGDIKRLLEHAVSQCPEGSPAAIFIDVNAVPSPGVPTFETTWAKEVLRSFGDDDIGRAVKRVNAIFITNFAYHYAGEGVAPAAEVATSLSTTPTTEYSEALIGAVVRSVDTYGFVPDHDVRPKLELSPPTGLIQPAPMGLWLPKND